MANELITQLPYTFEEIKDFILSKFKDKGYTIESSSNIGMIADILAYLAFYNNLNASFAAQESNIATASVFNNIMACAKNMGYIPKGINSYSYSLLLNTDSISNYGDKYTSGGNDYYYLGKQTTSDNITVIEGELIKDSLVLKSDSKYIDIPYIDLDAKSLTIYVNGVQWTSSSSILLDSADSENNKYIIWEYPDIEIDYTRIYFYLTNTGKILKAGTKIDYIGLKSKGAKGLCDKDSKFEGPNKVINATIHNIGSDRETVDQIKANTPIIYNTGNRLVTKLDYISLLKRYSEIKMAFAWGGEEEVKSIDENSGDYQYDLGVAYLSIIPYTAPLFDFNEDFKLKEKDNIIPFIFPYANSRVSDDINSLKVITLQVKYRPIVFIDCEVNIKVLNYGIGIIKEELNKQIMDSIIEYFKNNISKFENKCHESNLVNFVDNIVRASGTGVTLSVSYSIPLWKANIDENLGDVVFYLLPSLRNGLFPDLTTENFANSGKTLKVVDREETQYLTIKEFYLEDEVIGTLTMSKAGKTYIRCIIKCKDGAIGRDNLLLTNDNPFIINCKYEDNSLQTEKNSLIRLVGVNFE